MRKRSRLSEIFEARAELGTVWSAFEPRVRQIGTILHGCAAASVRHSQDDLHSYCFFLHRSSPARQGGNRLPSKPHSGRPARQRDLRKWSGHR